jgi:hypothetical protein
VSPKTMTGDAAPMESTAHVECMLDSDPRLIVAIGPIAMHAGRRAGLAPRDQENLAVAALEVCRKALPISRPKGSRRARIKMVVTDFPDRVELMIETTGKARATAQKSATANRKPAAAMLVDRLEQETRKGHSYTTLIKYCAGARARRKS